MLNRNLILFFLVTLAYPLAAEPLCKSPKSYIVDADVLNVRERPEVTSPILKTLVDGAIVKACITEKIFYVGGKSDYWYRLSNAGFVWGGYLQEAYEMELANGYSTIHAISHSQMTARVILLYKERVLCSFPFNSEDSAGISVSASGRYFILTRGRDDLQDYEIYRTEKCKKLLNASGLSMYNGGWKGERAIVRKFTKIKEGLCRYNDTIFDDGKISEYLSDTFKDVQSDRADCMPPELLKMLE